MKKQWIKIGLFSVWSLAAHATVQVGNVAVQQTEGSKQVEIQYDVSSDHASAVEVSVLLFDGSDQMVLSSLSGDVGSGIATGLGKTISWNAGADWGGQVASHLQLWIVADDGSDTSPAPIPGSKLVLAGSNSGTDPDFGSYALTLANGLWVDQGEVDKTLWDEVYVWAVANGYDFDNSGNAASNNHPVVAISWFDCVKWCNARSEKEGLLPGYEVVGETYRSNNSIPVWTGSNGYRLPSIEEWQYMARGGMPGNRFPWGDTISHDQANYFSVASSYDISATRGYHPDYSSGWPGTNPEDAFAANDLGLYDMAANVWEWCWDTAPEGRYMAGGSWQDSAGSARCGALLGDAPGNSRFNAGFRTVRSALDSLSGVANAAVDTRDYTLSISPAFGNPTPVGGIHTYAWRSSVDCSVDSLATEGGTNYYLVGWTGTGSVPASGTRAGTGPIVLGDPDSSIAWNWQEGGGDYDADGLSNDWEMDYFGSFTGAVAGANTDGDLFSNLQEYIAGTDPTNAASYFSVTSRVETNGVTAFVLEWDSVPNRVYNVQWSTNLLSGFHVMGDLEHPRNSYTNQSDSGSGFYKVDVRLK